MKINPSEKRIRFENLINKLGYRDRSPIILSQREDKWTKQTNYICPSGGSIGIYTYIILYQNKKSYLYSEFLDNYNEFNLEEKIKKLATIIKFKEKTRIAEVGWECIYNQDPTQFSLEERKSILFSFIKETNKNIQEGMCNINPKPGDMLAANPKGLKINQGYSESSIELGTRQRSNLAKKFGFGNVYEDGFSYARYNENLELIPV